MQQTYAASPLVTIVIPCRNEEQAIDECLDSVIRQTVTDTEILVVDGGSTDATADIVVAKIREDRRIRLLRNPRGIVPSALNIALDQAKGRWLVRVDAHCTVGDDYVERLVDHLEAGAGGAGGLKRGVGRTVTGTAIACAMSSKAGVGGSAYHHATRIQHVDHIPFGAYPVDLARQLGGWNEKLSVNQDFEFDVRLRATGRDLILDPSVIIDWENRQTFEALFRQYHRYGRGKTRVMLLHPRSVKVRHLVAPLFVAAVIASVLPWRWKHVAMVRRMLAACYGVVVGGAGLTAGRSLPRRHRWRVVVALVVMHVSWGLGFWHGIYDLAAGRTDRAIVDGDRLGPPA